MSIVMKSYKIFISFFLLNFFISPMYSQPAPEKTANEDTAKLLLLQFSNETKKKEFDNLKITIDEAIENRIREHFIYERPQKEKMQVLGNKTLPNSKYFKSRELKKLCITTDVDYVIFGVININKAARNNLTVHGGIFSKKDDKIISEKAVGVATDASMLNGINEMAESFVNAIKEYIKNPLQPQRLCLLLPA